MKLLPVKKIFRVYGNVCVRGQEVLHKKKGRLQASAEGLKQQCCLCRAVLWQSCSLHSLHVMTGFTRLRLGLTVRC